MMKMNVTGQTLQIIEAWIKDFRMKDPFFERIGATIYLHHDGVNA